MKRNLFRLKMVTIKAGQTATFECDVSGDPITDKVWRCEDGEPIVDNDKFTIVREDYYTSLTIRNAVRKDTARYMIRVDNKNGHDKEKVELVVLTRPGAPLGPLQVTNVLADRHVFSRSFINSERELHYICLAQFGYVLEARLILAQ